MEPADQYTSKPPLEATSRGGGHKQNRSVAGLDSGLCLFKPAKFEAGVKNVVTVQFYPLATIQRGKCIEFLIPETNMLYFALNKSVLKIKVKIRSRDDDKVPAKTARVSFVNATGASLFRQVDVSLQQKSIGSEISTHYPYKAILDSLIYSPEEYLSRAGMNYFFAKDSSYLMDGTTLSGVGANEGLMARNQFSAGGAEVLLHTPIFHDLFQVSEYLPPNMQIKLQCWPSSDDFVLMNGETTDSYLYHITDCVLEMTGVEPVESIYRKHQALMAKTNAVFHYKSSVLKTYNIPGSLSFWSIHQFLNNEIPSDLLVCFLSTDGFVGNAKLNPFNFANFNLNYICLEVEGYQSRVYRPDFEAKHFVAPYRALFEPDHGYMQAFTPIIQLADFGGGYAIYRFKLGNTQFERLARPKHGLSKLILSFAKPLPAPVTCLVYARFHDVLEIDLARNVYVGGECPLYK